MQYGVSTATSQLTAIGAVYHLCGTLDVKTDLQVTLPMPAFVTPGSHQPIYTSYLVGKVGLPHAPRPDNCSY